MYRRAERLQIYIIVVIASLCMLFACLMPLHVYAGSEEAEIVRVGYYENEVFQEGAEDGAIKSGYAYEYYRKISEYSGWKYEYVYGDFGDLYQMLLDGDIDLLAGLAWKEDRENLISYPYLPMGNETYNLVKHNTADDITADPASFSGKTIGVLDSALLDVLNKYLEENNVNADVKIFNGYTALFDAFDSGGLDLLAAEGDGAYGRDNAEVLIPFGSSDYYLCVSKSRPDLLNELNEAQEALNAEEPYYIYSLKTSYYPGSISARAFSDSEKEWLASHDSLRLGYLENYMPYSGNDEHGQATGIVKDIIPEMFKNLGLSDITPVFIGYKSYDDMISDMSEGVIDAAFPVGGGLYFSEENGLYQSEPVVSASTELVHKGEYTEETTTHFAVNENNRMQYYFVVTNFPDAEIMFYPSIEDCLEAVITEKATCTTLNGLRANDILKNRRYRDLSMHQLAGKDERCFGVEIGNEGLLKLLNRGINVVGSDYAQNISYRYVNDLYSYTLGDAILDHMGLAVAVILIIVAVIIFLLVRDRIRTQNQKNALKIALDDAEQANRAKTEFLNNMSHDIRTPMNAVVGFTALAKSHIDNKEEVKAYLENIDISSQHLLSLVNDVLDMSRIESGRMILDEEEVHLPDMVSNLKTIIQAKAAEKQLEFTVDEETLVHEDIVTDKVRLNQVLHNILSNAIKFTPEGGSVSFAVSEQETSDSGTANYQFRIKDTGIGMSEDFRKTIFEAFTREQSSTVSGIHGTGLGMAITRNIVDLMKGTITVHSEEGKGSEFVVDIPCRFVSPSGSAEQDSGLGDDKLKHNGQRDFAGKRVLLAEDNELNQMIASAILSEAGFEVEIANDGEIAVEKIKAADPGYYDIILMDIQMPNMDGYEAAKNIRHMDDPEKADIPIVALTANAFEEGRQNSLEAGMNGHLTKPYDIPKLMKTLDNLL